MIKVIINAFGPDKPGIVYNLSKLIFSLKGNISESKMLRLESDFTLLMLITIPEKNFILLEEKLNRLTNLKLNFKITKEHNKNEKYQYFQFSVNVADNEGIIYNFSELFNKYKVNIEKMESEIINAYVTGSPIFKLKSRLSAQNSLNLIDFEASLKKIAEENNIEYTFKKL
tara:strand:- start:4031 stop:4543 length:513 start_codon:yes stop_codon:yes gene_type:complete